MKTEDLVKWKIGKTIKKYRDIKGLTQLELAERVGISRNGLWNYENDKRAIDHDTLMEISNALGIGVLELLGLDEDERIKLLSVNKILDPFLFDKIKDLENYIDLLWSDNGIDTTTFIQIILIDWFAKHDALFKVYKDDSHFDIFRETEEGWVTGSELYNSLHESYTSELKEEKRKEVLDHIHESIIHENLDSPSQYFVALVKDYVQEFGMRGLSQTLTRLIRDLEEINDLEEGE